MESGRSIHRRAADHMAEVWAETAWGARALAGMYRWTRDEEWSARIAVLGQPFTGWDMGQLFALRCLAGLWMEGLLTIAEAKVGAKPKRDAERQANQSALDRLPAGISATVDADQRGADDDGSVRWGTPLQGHFNDPDTCESQPDTIAPGWAPLEIGNTDASNVCFHLNLFGAVARWPYGDETLTIMQTRPGTLIQGWRFGDPTPDRVMDDLVEFSNWIATGRMLGPKMMRVMMRGAD
ncbi:MULTISPECIES: hypothetical protein [Streptomyces]|nr:MULTISPECIES: hypothetical protein [Streptomyces]